MRVRPILCVSHSFAVVSAASDAADAYLAQAARLNMPYRRGQVRSQHRRNTPCRRSYGQDALDGQQAGLADNCLEVCTHKAVAAVCQKLQFRIARVARNRL